MVISLDVFSSFLRRSRAESKFLSENPYFDAPEQTRRRRRVCADASAQTRRRRPLGIDASAKTARPGPVGADASVQTPRRGRVGADASAPDVFRYLTEPRASNLIQGAFIIGFNKSFVQWAGSEVKNKKPMPIYIHMPCQGHSVLHMEQNSK